MTFENEDPTPGIKSRSDGQCENTKTTLEALLLEDMDWLESLLKVEHPYLQVLARTLLCSKKVKEHRKRYDEKV